MTRTAYVAGRRGRLVAHREPVRARLEPAHDPAVAPAATVVVPRHDGAGVGRPVEGQHGVERARRGDDVRAGRGDVEAERVDLAAATDGGRRGAGADGQLDRALVGRPGTATA